MQQSDRDTFYLGHIGPIPLYAHWTAVFLILLVYQWSGGAGPAFSFEIFLILLTVLVIGIVLHEMGHGLVARALGAAQVTITLWAFGGLCKSHRDTLPAREIWIVAAGPAVSFLLALIGWAGLTWLEEHQPGWLIDGDRHSILDLFLWYTMSVNLIMGIFNMLPIYPLDGGKIVFNILQLITKRELLARQISLTFAVLGGVALLSYTLYSYNYDFFNTTVLMRIGLIGWLMMTAFRYLH